MLKHVRAALALGAGLSLLAVTGCNPAGPAADPAAPSASQAQDFAGPATGALRTSGFSPSDEVGKARSDLAQQKLADVTVTMDTTDFDTQKFAAQVASGSAPDLVQVDREIIGTLADKGLIVPLDACYTQHQVEPASATTRPSCRTSPTTRRSTASRSSSRPASCWPIPR
ncbi:hypothetical protein [Luteococcus peritonei]|uniref:Extracellular solute-binding protein n=1 Tax=Luteococcus peritonei TaxID=88874 RepID=A0ABW4RTG3_9ACTN